MFFQITVLRAKALLFVRSFTGLKPRASGKRALSGILAAERAGNSIESLFFGGRAGLQPRVKCDYEWASALEMFGSWVEREW